MDKERIRESSDIVEVISSLVPLKKRGRNWVGLCPFHQEKTPSFHVDPVTQTFKCFGCGLGGDVFTFVERYHNMDFAEAAEFLARRAGLPIEVSRPEHASTDVVARERIYAVNKIAAAWFQAMLERNPHAQEYLERRRLAPDTVRRFGIGYAPDNWTGLTDHFKATHHSLDAVLDAGLVARGSSGDLYDVFRNRIIFPIQDEQERIVGFGGRTLTDEVPKYLNTAETSVFSKSKLLYGLPFARRAIAAQGRTLLMEGYMDVIAAQQAGFAAAVATLGTALTEHHARKLARLAPKVILVYDADSAGIKATLRASELLEHEGLEVRIAALPEGEDPDALVRRGEIATLERAIDGAIGRVEYQLRRVIAESDTSTASGRARMLRQILYVLATVPTRAERDAYIQQIWQYHPMSSAGPGVASEQMHRDAEAIRAARRPGGPAPGSRPATRSTDGGASDMPQHEGVLLRRSERPSAEAEILRALAHPQWRDRVLQLIEEADLPSEDARRFYRLVAGHKEELKTEGDLVAVLDRFEDADFALMMRTRLQEIHALMAKVPLDDTVIVGCARTLKHYRFLRVKREWAQFLQSKPVLTEEDRERVREYERLLQNLKGAVKGSASTRE
ncbi:MAG: DNA primase [Chthonomonadales bacterium]